ncbi:BMP family lipoprotein [Candidatus Planktophila dulcis]|uniref:BMP family lipoprotein n=1 Tax=Candidatus Planktophila dulcis TaxID=1884914 RepID=UPI003CE68342
MKIRSILLAVVLGASLVSAPTHAAPELSVGVAYDIGGRGDKSFNDASAAGLEKAQKQFDFNLEAVVTDGTSADREKRIRSLITKKCNPIIAIGAGYAVTLQALAVEFPNTQFAIINDASVAALNVTSVVFADTQGAYLAGFSAAQVSKSGKVAMIANPDQADLYKDGFSAGVFASKKKVIPIVKYVSGSYSLATSQVLDAGADVVFVATHGSNSEIFKVIVSRNAKKKGSNIGLINIEPDQYITVTSATKKFLFASVVKRVDKAIYDVIALSVAKKAYLDILDGDAGIYGRRYGITGGGIEFTIRSKELAALSDSINLAAATAEKILA